MSKNKKNKSSKTKKSNKNHSNMSLGDKAAMQGLGRDPYGSNKDEEKNGFWPTLCGFLIIVVMTLILVFGKPW